MEKCDLTQVPCRKEIMRIVNSNKSKASLQHTCQLAKLFQTADSKHPDLTEKEWTKYFIIIKLLMLDDLRLLRLVDVYLYNLMK